MSEREASGATVRVACVDVGSNTTRLLVADVRDGRLTVVTERKSYTAVGRATPAEVTAVVAEQLAAARAARADEVRGVATAAVRGRSDGRALVAAIRAATGLELTVLSPEDEAQLAFGGAIGMLDGPAPAGLIGVVDVGGGSSELAVGEAGGPLVWWESVPLGSRSVTERWLLSDPPRSDEMLAALVEIRAAMARLSPPTPRTALAVGGSATSLGRVAGRRLDRSACSRALYLLGSAPAAALAASAGVDPQRVRLLPAALMLLETAAARLQRPLAVCAGGIREGVLLRAAAEARC